LTSTKGYPQIVFNEAIGGDKSADALNMRIDSILERHPNANIVVILLGTNDANASVSISQYTNNMQTLINVVLTDGKQVWVARVLPIFNTDGTPNTTRNNLIQSYNQAIDGSASTPLIGHTLGPDFFNFFLTRAALMDDTLHPNEDGHEAIAYLWQNFIDPGNPLDLPSYLLNP
jgi:lysophospholipase L1-like esterase